MVSNVRSKTLAKSREVALNRSRMLLFHASLVMIALLFSILGGTSANAACRFIVPDGAGQPVNGPSFEHLPGGFTHGALDCEGEIHGALVMTIQVDPAEPYIGVRDEPLFRADVTGPLERLSNIFISDTTQVHILGRVNASSQVGWQRGSVRFATMCDRTDGEPLNCSWGDSRIKFRSTAYDTDNDERLDRAYHELSVYHAEGRLHMVTFWTPYRGPLEHDTSAWIDALDAFGVDVLLSSRG